MTYSYTSPSASDKDAVRFAVGDTDSTDWLLSDEEIQYLIDTYGLSGAKWRAAKAIAAKFARMATSEKDGDISRNYDRYQYYIGLADKLKSEAAMGGGMYAGGISKDDKEANEDNTDIVQPAFKVNQFDTTGDDPDWLDDE